MSPGYATRPAISVDGLPLDPGLVPLTEIIEVDDHQYLPDRFQIVFADPDGETLTRSRVRIGSAVRISGQAMGEPSEALLIEAEVTALEGEFGSEGARITIRGYDQSHRLVGLARTASYSDVTDSDIARTVAQRAGLQAGSIDESSLTHRHMSQLDQTDWDFLRARAREIGYDVRVAEGKLDFQQRRQASDAPAEGDLSTHQPLQLVWGSNLREFYPRITATEQVREVEVRGWDVANKQAIVGQATAATTGVQLQEDPAALAGVFGQDRWVGVSRTLTAQADADEAAASEAERIASTHAEAEGVAFGNPALKAGASVNISGVGRFSGRYVLTHTRHTFDGQGYRTTFQVAGRHDRSLLGLVTGALPGGNGTGSRDDRIHGFAIAIVTDNKDPDDLGRVKVKFPALDPDYESHWVRVALPGAGPDAGLVFLPDVNDEVLVGFEHGDIRRPYVVGGLWNGIDKPPLGADLFDNGHVRRRGIVSRSGHKLVFFDDTGKSGIGLLSGDGTIRIALNQSASQLTLHSDGTVEVRSKGDMTLRADANLTIKAGGNLELEGSGNVKLKGGGIVDIDGSLIQLN
jgi:uncharacterized protein involved in type VI secretion and phage assembly